MQDIRPEAIKEVVDRPRKTMKVSAGNNRSCKQNSETFANWKNMMALTCLGLYLHTLTPTLTPTHAH